LIAFVSFVLSAVLSAAQPVPDPLVAHACFVDIASGRAVVIFKRLNGKGFGFSSSMSAQQASAEFGIPIIGMDESPPWECGWLEGDANHDGVVNFDDITSVHSSWLRECEAPRHGK